MMRIRSSSLTTEPAPESTVRAIDAVVRQVSAQMREATEALAERAEQLALERRSLVDSIQDEGLRRSVTKRR